jgi:hypothetical protein
VDNQLLALKQKMGMLGAGTTTNKAIGAGQREADDVHADIERPGGETKR